MGASACGLVGGVWLLCWRLDCRFLSARTDRRPQARIRRRRIKPVIADPSEGSGPWDTGVSSIMAEFRQAAWGTDNLDYAWRFAAQTRKSTP